MRYLKLMIFLLLLCLPSAAFCQNLQKAGATDVGILYVDIDSVQSVSRGGQLYLAVFAEEKYTDADYLKSLREEELLAQAASAMYLYLFNQKGTEYTVAARYILDSSGRVCADLGADVQLQQVAGNETMFNAYTKALDGLNAKSRQSKWLHKK